MQISANVKESGYFFVELYFQHTAGRGEGWSRRLFSLMMFMNMRRRNRSAEKCDSPPKRFYLLVSTKVTNRYSTREIDITLVCPKVSFLLK